MVDVDALEKITTDEEYGAVIGAVTVLLAADSDPLADTPEGKRLNRLSDLASTYEETRWPIYAPNYSPDIHDIFSDEELDVINDFARKKEMSITAVLRQALRVYQAVERREAAGYAVDLSPPDMQVTGCMGDD